MGVSLVASSVGRPVATGGDFDTQLDALSGLLTDMKGIQEATASEMHSQDTLIHDVIDKCDKTTARIGKANTSMEAMIK